MFRADLATALAVSILMWRDSVSAKTKFPRLPELVRIELGRILSHPCIDIPGFRAKLGVLYHTLTVAEPWDIHVTSILRAYESRFSQAELDEIGKCVAKSAHHDKAAFDIILRNGKEPTATAERIVETTHGLARILGVPDSYQEIEAAVRDTYYGVYRQIN